MAQREEIENGTQCTLCTTILFYIKYYLCIKEASTLDENKQQGQKKKYFCPSNFSYHTYDKIHVSSNQVDDLQLQYLSYY